MTRKLKSLLVLVMLISVPVRGIAAVTAGFCGYQETLAHSEAAHEHGGEHQHHGSADGEHCGTASFAAPAATAPVAGPAGSERIICGDRIAAGFVPDHLDPPPLAL